MQVISAEVLPPEPSALRNLSAISFTFHAMPEIELALLPTAPMMPETCEPWPLSSVGLPELVRELMPLMSLAIPLEPGVGLTQRLALRSVWVRRRSEERR